MSVSILTEGFDFNTYLKDAGGRDLKEEDLKYIFEHFVLEKTSAERHQDMMAMMKKQTKALETVIDIDNRLCILEEDKKRKQRLLPVKTAAWGIAIVAITTVMTNLHDIAKMLHLAK